MTTKRLTELADALESASKLGYYGEHPKVCAEASGILRQLAANAVPVDPVEAAVDEYLSNYMLHDGNGYSHSPDDERDMLKDAIMGLLVNGEFVKAFYGSLVPEPCPKRGSADGCPDRLQCFEPCGNLGHDERHVGVAGESISGAAIRREHEDKLNRVFRGMHDTIAGWAPKGSNLSDVLRDDLDRQHARAIESIAETLGAHPQHGPARVVFLRMPA